MNPAASDPCAADRAATTPWPARVPVLVAGGGPVGLTLAALLASHGVEALVVEADAGYCIGSRAICISRRSQEILGWVGADRPLVDKGLAWTGGRSWHRDTEVLHFTMPSEPTERFAPMVNIQQYHVEEYAHRAADGADVRWSSRVAAVRQRDDGVEVEVDVESEGGGRVTVRADWLVACDGGRSTVREQLGLRFEGMQYEGRYVIVDIEQQTARPVERLAWFDPPSNPGSTILMHRQPGDVWRIDYQIGDDEDADEAVKPDNVLPRVRSHLEMIGETAPWRPLWISLYNAKCLTLPDYRSGRVLFAGDAAHLVPIFGVRGLNSGLDDAGNLAWKLALVIRGEADDSLLDSYSVERVHATRQNLAYGAKSTEFMAPPHAGFRLMREAALRLAREDAVARSLVNPRQSTPIVYAGSPLNIEPAKDHQLDAAGARAGEPAPEALLEGAAGPEHLTARYGHGFVALWFSDEAALPAPLQARAADAAPGVGRLDVLRIASGGAAPAVAATAVAIDRHGEARRRYAAAERTLVVVRPDGYVLGRWQPADDAALGDALDAALAPYRGPHRRGDRSFPGDRIDGDRVAAADAGANAAVDAAGARLPTPTSTSASDARSLRTDDHRPAAHDTAATPADDLDRTYTELAEALGRVGEARAPLLLSTLVLALVARQREASSVLPLIGQAERLSGIRRDPHPPADTDPCRPHPIPPPDPPCPAAVA